MGLVQDIAQTQLEQGRIQGEGAARAGQIWGTTIANLGQLPAQIRQQQQQDQENQFRQQELGLRTQSLGLQVQQQQNQMDQQRRAQAANDFIGKNLGQSINSDGTPNFSFLADAAKTSPDIAAVYPELLERLNKASQSTLQLKQAQELAQQHEADQMGDFAAAARTAKDPADQAAIFGTLLKHAVASKTVDPQHATDTLSQMLGPDGTPDPQGVQGVFARIDQLTTAGKQARADRAKIREIPAGGTLGSVDAGPLMSGAPKPVANEMEAAIAAVAKDPAHPTPAEYAQALARVKVQPEEPVVTIRTMENGKPVEKVLPRADAVGKTFPSQPPASVIYPKPDAASLPAVEIKPNSREYRLAQDLAYGTLTMADFNRIYGRAASNANLKVALYDKARELNPNFNPAQFELGFKMASNPQIRQRLVAIDSLDPVIDKIEGLAKQADFTSLPAVNKLLSAGKFQLGNKTVTDYRQLQTLLGDEVGNALGVGSGSDLKTKLGLDLVNPNLGPQQFVSTMEQLRTVLQARRAALAPTMGPYAGVAGASTPQATPGSEQRQRVIGPNGQTGTVPAGTSLPPGWKTQ